MATGRVVEVKGKKGVYHIIIELGRVAGKRKRVRRTFHGRKRDAEKEKDRLMQQLGVGVSLDADGISTGDYLKQWLEGRKPNLAQSTYESYNIHIEKHIIPILGHIPLAKLHPVAIDEFKAQKLDPEKSGLAPRTVDAILTTLNQALKRAVKLRLLPYNPVAAVERPKYDNKKIQVLEIDELRYLLNAVQTHPQYPLFYLAAYTGMRRGELLGLTWEHVDLDSGDVTICQQWAYTKKDGLHMGPLKSEAAYRTIAISEDVVAVLKRTERKTPYLFPSPETGLPYHPHNTTKEFKRVAKRAGFETLRLHDLRHTHASHLLAAGVPLSEVQARLGHSLPSTTADNYIHPIESRRRNAANAFAKLMDDAPANTGGEVVMVDFSGARRARGIRMAPKS